MSLPTGTLKPGSPADLTIFNPEATVTVKAAEFRSKSRNTPFEGWQLHGKPVATILGGKRVALPDGAGS